MKKKLFAVLVAIAFLNINVLTQDNINVIVNGEEIVSEQPPIVENEKVFVPAKAVLEKMNMKVEWINEDNTINTTDKNGKKTSIIIGDDIIINGSSYISIDSAAKMLNGKLLIPLEAISEGFGADVKWDSANKKVIINKNDVDNSNIETGNISKEYKSDDGKVTFITTNINYPILKKGQDLKVNENIDNINSKILRDVNGIIDKIEKEYIKGINEAYNYSKELNFDFRPEEIDTNFEIMLNSKDVVSILMIQVENLGGAHPNTIKYSYNFDLNTGNEIKAEEFLSMNKAELDKIVKTEFENKIKENPELYFEDALTLLGELEGNIPYYLTNKGVTYFIAPYEIAPYAGGFQEVTIKKDLLIPEDVVNGFFNAFKNSDYENMKDYCTQNCIDKYFLSNSVYGMKSASIDNIVDIIKEDETTYKFFVDVNIKEAAELSIFSKEDRDTSLFVVLTKEDGMWKVNEFTQG